MRRASGPVDMFVAEKKVQYQYRIHGSRFPSFDSKLNCEIRNSDRSNLPQRYGAMNTLRRCDAIRSADRIAEGNRNVFIVRVASLTVSYCWLLFVSKNDRTRRLTV